MLACSSFPHLHRRVIAGGCYVFAAGRACQGLDGERVTAVDMDGRLWGLCAPHLDGGVVSSGGDVAAIRCPRQSIDRAGVTTISLTLRFPFAALEGFGGGPYWAWPHPDWAIQAA